MMFAVDAVPLGNFFMRLSITFRDLMLLCRIENYFF